MKKIKYSLYIIVLMLVNTVIVQAAGSEVGTLQCNYTNSQSDTINITYYNVSAVVGDADVKYKVTYTTNNTTHCYSTSTTNPCDTNTVQGELYEIHNFDTNFKYGDLQFYGIASRLRRYSANEQQNFDAESLCSKKVLIDDKIGLSKYTVVLCETSNETNECSYNNSNLFSLSGKSITTQPYAGASKNSDEIQATNYSGSSNVTPYGKDEKVCETYLGDGTEGTPLYYLKWAFNAIQYAAIILFLVLTVIEFAKAVTSDKNDAIKTAGIKTAKRLIIAVVIFLLPILIEFILGLVGLSGGTCGIR